MKEHQPDENEIRTTIENLECELDHLYEKKYKKKLMPNTINTPMR